MSSCIIDLQNEVLSPNCDIVSVLRKAYVIASELKLCDFKQWIYYELNGYTNEHFNQQNRDMFPEYREVCCDFGKLRGYSYEVVNNLPKLLGKIKIIDSIPKIVEMCKRYEQDVPLTYPDTSPLYFWSEKFDPSGRTVHVKAATLVDVIEKTKNRILDWLLELKQKGIVGENMEFSDNEKKTAENIPQTVNNYYGATNVVNGASKDMQILSGNANVNLCKDCDISDIENSIIKEKLPKEIENEALKLLKEIKDKISQKEKPKTIKLLMVKLKDLLLKSAESFGLKKIINWLEGKISNM